jgi:hypothetical protein
VLTTHENRVLATASLERVDSSQVEPFYFPQEKIKNAS